MLAWVLFSIQVDIINQNLSYWYLSANIALGIILTIMNGVGVPIVRISFKMERRKEFTDHIRHTKIRPTLSLTEPLPSSVFYVIKWLQLFICLISIAAVTCSLELFVLANNSGIYLYTVSFAHLLLYSIIFLIVTACSGNYLKIDKINNRWNKGINDPS